MCLCGCSVSGVVTVGGRMEDVSAGTNICTVKIYVVHMLKGSCFAILGKKNALIFFSLTFLPFLHVTGYFEAFPAFSEGKLRLQQLQSCQ